MVVAENQSNDTNSMGNDLRLNLPNSKLFNLTSEDLFGTQTKTFMFASGKNTEYYDKVTDSWQQASICKMGGNWRSIKGSQWVWIRESATLEEAKTGTKNRFRLKLNLPSDCRGECIVRADLFLRSSDGCRLNINDVGLNQDYGGATYPEPFIVDVGKYLKPGGNTIYFELMSFSKPDAKNPEDNLNGLIYRLHLEYRE